MYIERERGQTYMNIQKSILSTAINVSNSILSEINIADEYYYEEHPALTNFFHDKMNSNKYIKSHHIFYDSSVNSKFYTSKYDCIKERDKCIKEAYDKAQKYLDSDSSLAFSKEATEYYCKRIEDAFCGYLTLLENICNATGNSEIYDALQDKIKNCRTYLGEKFVEELTDNYDYYRMYKFDYFIEQTEIEEHDFRITENGFMHLVETLFADNVQYTINGIHKAISEIQNDIDSFAGIYFNAVYNIYFSYVKDIEKLLDIIGVELPEMNENEEPRDYLKRCNADV